MTAINAFFDSNSFAYLGADGAVYSYDDGKITDLRSKVFAFPKYGFVAAFTGPDIGQHVADIIHDEAPEDQQAALELMRLALLTCRAAMLHAKPEGEDSVVNDMVAVAAIYLEHKAEAAIWSLSTHEGANVEGEAPKWCDITGVFIPSTVPPYIAARGYVSDPVTDSRALFRAQRHHEFEGMHGAPAVGGTCSLYRVGPDGIMVQDILDFGDEIGKRADIYALGRDLLKDVDIGIA
jgi:hypothetical protein